MSQWPQENKVPHPRSSIGKGGMGPDADHAKNESTIFSMPVIDIERVS